MSAAAQCMACSEFAGSLRQAGTAACVCGKDLIAGDGAVTSPNQARPASLPATCHRVQDDAHIFCLPNQIEAEILGVLDMTERLLSQFGFQDFEASVQTGVRWGQCRQMCLLFGLFCGLMLAGKHHWQPVHGCRSICPPVRTSMWARWGFGTRQSRHSRRHCSARCVGTHSRFMMVAAHAVDAAEREQGRACCAAECHQDCRLRRTFGRAGHSRRMWAAAPFMAPRLT